MTTGLVPEPAIRELMADLIGRAYRITPAPDEEETLRGQYMLGKADAYSGVVASLEELIGTAAVPAPRRQLGQEAAG